MNKDLINTAILASSFLGLFGIAELLYYKLKVKAELTRKLVHFGTGILTLLFPIMLGNQWLVLFLCATFAIIILASLKFNFLRSINGIERKSHGSISYPISVYTCYLVYDHFLSKPANVHPYIYFYLPVLSLAICDPMAALVGKRFPYGRFTIGKDTKTIMGSMAFFVSSIILSLSLYSALSIGAFSIIAVLLPVLFIALFATIAEALSGKGIDNITIPLTVALILILLS